MCLFYIYPILCGAAAKQKVVLNMHQNTQNVQKQGIPPERAVALINAMIDRMVNDAGGHVREVIGTLLDIGFTKEELVDTFQFTQSDVDDCVAETDDSGEV